MTQHPRTTKTSKPSKFRGRGALLIITSFLAISGIIRIGEGAGDALALVTQSIDHTTQNDFHNIAQTPSGCAAFPGAMEMLTALQKREERIAQRESLIADRLQALNLAEQEITKRVQDLKQAEERLSATMAIADQAAEQDLAQLTTVYENMKAKDAAALFEKMEPDFAAGFLARMRPDAAGAVMAGLQPEKAYMISILLAGRNANTPRN